MKRRIFATLLAFCLIASLCVVGAAADGPVATVNGEEFDNLQAAIDNASDGDVITLLQNVDLGNTNVVFNKSGCSIVLDLNTFTLSRSTASVSDSRYYGEVILVTDGELTLRNGTVENTVATSCGTGAISVSADTDPNTETSNTKAILIVESTATVLATSYTGIGVFGNVAQVDVYGTVEGNYYGVAGNGTNRTDLTYGGTVINIYDGANITHTCETDGVGIFQSQLGITNIYGGTIRGLVGVQVSAGTINISGGNIIAEGEIPSSGNIATPDNNYTYTSSGNIVDGAALSIVNRSGGYAGYINVNITGGNFYSENGDAVLEYTANANCEKVDSISITGGTFNGANSDINVQLKDSSVAEPVVEGGSFSESVAAYVADGLEYEANSDGVYTYHSTIESAVAAAGSGGSVSMISNGEAVDPGDEGVHTITRIDGGSETTMTVTDGYVYTLPELDKNGYTFVGWRVNNSNTILKPGDTYTVNSDVTFTAVWNMINVPDTYEISVISSDGGTVEASLSNASAGSVITLTVTPDEGYELAYITVDGERISGTSFVMPDHSVEVRAVFTEIGAEMSFVDVSRSDWFYDAVEYVYTNGLMEGTSTRTFEPNATMTRAMFWTVLARIDGETITGDNWKTLAQNWAVSSGISDGTNADALITREQMVTMLYRFANSPEVAATGFGQFTDGASVSDWAVDAIAWALNNGVITGMGDGILSPAGSATRAQAAAMLMRFVEA